MEFVTLMAILVAYLGISFKLDRVIHNQIKDDKKRFPSLSKVVGKKIKFETSDDGDLDLDVETKGILKEFNDKWIVIERIDKKNKKELYYYRLNSITSIDIIEE